MLHRRPRSVAVGDRWEQRRGAVAPPGIGLPGIGLLGIGSLGIGSLGIGSLELEQCRIRGRLDQMQIGPEAEWSSYRVDPPSGTGCHASGGVERAPQRVLGLELPPRIQVGCLRRDLWPRRKGCRAGLGHVSVGLFRQIRLRDWVTCCRVGLPEARASGSVRVRAGSVHVCRMSLIGRVRSEWV